MLSKNGRPLRVLTAFNQHRGGGGADNMARATVEVCREGGLDVQLFTRSSEDLPPGLRGRVHAGVSAIYAPGALGAFGRAVDEFQPDLVHAHEVFPLVSPWIFPFCRRRGIPLVITFADYRLTCPVVTHLREGNLCTLCSKGSQHHAVLHNCRGSFPESVSVTLYNLLVRKLRLMVRNAQEFTACSQFTADWLVRYAGLPADRMTAINPVIRIPAEPADPASGTYVALAARLAVEKGIDVFVRAARLTGLPFRIARHRTSMVYVEVPPEVPVEITDSAEDLARFYRGARMKVFPSRFFETFGIVAGESMSHGIPVIASRFGAMEGLVEDGVSGCLFERDNAAELARIVTALWHNPQCLREMGNRARERAIALWRPERHFELTMDVYRRAMARGAGR